MGIASTMVRGVQRMRAGVTLDGKEVDGRMFPVDGPGRSIALVGNKSATFEEFYRTQVWVQAVVNRLARSIGRLPLKIYVNPDEPRERERVRTGTLAELLARPGPKLGPNALKQAIVSNVAIHGNAIVVKNRGLRSGPPVGLTPSSAAYWRVVSLPGGDIRYQFASGQGPMWFYPDEILHFRWWAGGAGLWAASPLDALRTTLMAEDAAQRLQIASFENGNRPLGAYSVDGTPRPEEIERARAQLQEIYGGVDNAFKIAILSNNAKWQPMAHTLVDSDLVRLRQLNREEVAAAYNMPPPVIGILDRATFSNITEQHLMEYVDTVQPWTDMIQEALAIQLVADERLMEGQYVEFDFNAVLSGDPVKRIEVLTKAIGGPFMTANEGRATQNLPPIDAPEADRLAPPPNASIRGGNRDDGDS